MIECVFTLDYEIYGNGEGSLRDLVLDPTRRLAELFQEFGAPFVVFAEAVEFARMEETQSDPDTAGVRAQLRELRAAGHEIALHLHPWWANARYEDGRWHLDWSERNICTLEPNRVEAIVSEAIRYLRDGLDDPQFHAAVLSERSLGDAAHPGDSERAGAARRPGGLFSVQGRPSTRLGAGLPPGAWKRWLLAFWQRRQRTGPSWHALGNPDSYADGAVLANAGPQAPEAAKQNAQRQPGHATAAPLARLSSVFAIPASWTSAE